MDNQKIRLSLDKMPSDIKRNPISKLPYLNGEFNLFKAEAEEAGFEIEHLYEGHYITTLEARQDHELIVETEDGKVKAIY